MRSKNIELMNKIKIYIEDCFENNHRMPTVREIAKEMTSNNLSVTAYAPCAGWPTQ